MSRTNPYTVLKHQFAQWVTAANTRRRIPMWTYPKDRLDDTWQLRDLAQRVAAAHQLGYEVHLRSTEAGLHAEYVADLPKHPLGL